jgi:hypothetical protein
MDALTPDLDAAIFLSCAVVIAGIGLLAIVFYQQAPAGTDEDRKAHYRHPVEVHRFVDDIARERHVGTFHSSHHKADVLTFKRGA